MKPTFNFQNFLSQNTPGYIQAIGNWLLVLSAIGGFVLTIPITQPTVILPHWVMMTAGIMASFGALGKMITKMFGKNDNRYVAPDAPASNG